MEVLIYCYILLPITLLLSSLYLLKRNPNRKAIPDLLPPGPRNLPFLGSLHHLAGSLPHHSLRRLSASHGPVMHLQLGEIPLVVVSSADAAREVLNTQDPTFASRPSVFSIDTLSYGGQDIIFAPYGPFWRQMRRLCVVELLSPKRVASFRSIREQEVLRFVQSINAELPAVAVVDLSKKLVELTSNITMRAVIGRPCMEHDTFLEMLCNLMEVTSGFSAVDLFPSLPIIGWLTGSRRRVERIFSTMDRMLDEIVREHVEKRRGDVVATEMEEDLLDVLLRMREEGGLDQLCLSMENIKAAILDMFVAGSETASTTLEWAMSELIRNPNAMSRAQKEVRSIIHGKTEVTISETETLSQLSYINLVIKETLRLHPPAPLLLPRECREKCRLLGYEIPAKMRVIVNAWAIGRDPMYWDNADEFKPERFEGSSNGSNALMAESFKGSTNFNYLPFGAGRRKCPGIEFGLATVALALAQLLCYFDWEQAEKDAELNMTEAFGLTSRRKKPLLLRAIPLARSNKSC